MESSIRYPLGTAQAEELALRAGFKPALRQRLAPGPLRAQADRFRAQGFACAVDAEAGLLVVAEAPARAAAILNLEAAQRAGTRASRRDAVREQGLLLGYPECCATTFAHRLVERGEGGLWACRAALLATAGALAPRLNVLDPAVFHYPSWLPCAFDCAPSVAYADRLAALIARRFPVFVGRVDYALTAHRLVVADGTQLSLVGGWRGDALVVERAWWTGADRRPSSRRDPRERWLADRLVPLLRGRALRLEGGRLLVGERLALRSPLLRLFPFGGRPGDPGASAG